MNTKSQSLGHLPSPLAGFKPGRNVVPRIRKRELYHSATESVMTVFEIDNGKNIFCTKTKFGCVQIGHR